MVASAAEDAGIDAGAFGENPEDEDEGEDGDESEGKTFGKSLGANADGDELVDATDLVKSILARQEGSEQMLTKAVASMAGTLTKQNDLIKSLQSEMRSLAGAGRGRKTMVSIAEKVGVSDMVAKSEGASTGAITGADLLVKSNAAHAAKKISGVELNTIDVCLRNGWPIDPGILQRVALA